MESIKNEVTDFVKANYSKSKVKEMINEEIPNWVPSDWKSDYPSQAAAYEAIGDGEVENVVREKIETAVLAEFKITYSVYQREAGEELWDTLIEMRPILNGN